MFRKSLQKRFFLTNFAAENMAVTLGLPALPALALRLLKDPSRNTLRNYACYFLILFYRSFMAFVGSQKEGYVGKLGTNVYFKGPDGKTVVRELVIPKNPKTLAQRVQRVITKTVGDNYKVMKAIADHSFEGKSMGAKCANRFRSLNAIRMRERANYLQQQGVSLYSYNNFEKIGETKFKPAAVFISEGSLKQVTAIISGVAGKVVVAENTYASVIAALGAQRGDQMTFVTVEKDAAGDYTFNYARVILDPRNENGAAALSVPFIEGTAINCPNSRNKGSFAALSFDGGINYRLTAGTVVAAGIIMSRKSDSKWLRSTCQLTLSEANIGSDLCSLMAAAESTGAVELDVDSEQYLNNAGTGGVEGATSSAPSADPGTTGDGTPTLGTYVKVNGANQTIASVNTSVTSLTNFKFLGTDLSGASFHMKKNNDTTEVAPTSTSDTEISWDITGAVLNDQYKFYMNGVLKFAVNIYDGGGQDSGDGFTQ